MRLRFLVAVAVMFVVLSRPDVVLADGPQPGQPGTPMGSLPNEPAHLSVRSGPSGVTIVISMTATTPGQSGRNPSTTTIGGPAAPVCTTTPMNIGNASVGWVREGLAANPNTLPWTVNCENGYFGIAWVPTNAPDTPTVVISDPGAPPVDPAALAASVLGTVPLPPIAVGASPGVGLVALPSWFWVDGYDGSTLRGSRTLGLVTVEVEITPQNYRWTFGDGRAIDTTSLGRPYPTESDIQHVYERSSFTGATYDVELAITFTARYRVNGGVWVPLAPVTQTYTRDYAVRQLQSVLTSNQ